MGLPVDKSTDTMACFHPYKNESTLGWKYFLCLRLATLLQKDLYFMYSSTSWVIPSRKETKPMTLVRPLPSTSCSSIRKFSKIEASSCPPRMNMSLGVMHLSCFILLMVVLNTPGKVFCIID